MILVRGDIGTVPCFWSIDRSTFHVTVPPPFFLVFGVHDAFHRVDVFS